MCRISPSCISIVWQPRSQGSAIRYVSRRSFYLWHWLSEVTELELRSLYRNHRRRSAEQAGERTTALIAFSFGQQAAAVVV